MPQRRSAAAAAAAAAGAAACLLAGAAAQPGVGLDVLTEPCVNATAPTFKNQSWVWRDCVAGSGACLIENAGFAGLCVRGGPTETNLVLAVCDASDVNQQFVFENATGAIAQMPLSVKQYWNVYGGVMEPPGTNIQVFPDSSIPGNEQFAILPTGQIWTNGSQMCVDMSPPPPPPPPPAEWTWVPGVLGGADALPAATLAIDDAKAACAVAALCHGISWPGPLNPATPQLFSFKSSTVATGSTGNSLLRCGVQTPC